MYFIINSKIINQRDEYKTSVSSSDVADYYCYTIRTTTSGLTVYGSFGVSNAYTSKTFSSSSSDRRLKENIKDSTIDALSIINRIRHRQFDWIADKRHMDVGYIAQELEEIDQRLVIKPNDETETYGVDSFYLQGVMSKAIQQLSSEIDKLKEENKKLKEIIQELKDDRR